MIVPNSNCKICDGMGTYIPKFDKEYEEKPDPSDCNCFHEVDIQ